MPNGLPGFVRPMPVYVISLERSPERLATFLARNAHLENVERARAVDGEMIDRNDLLARGVIAPGLGYSQARLGCAMSHACLWQIVAAGDAPVTIAEDDAIFRHDFAGTASRLLAGLPADWDLVLWGWNFNSVLALDLIPGVSSAVVIGDIAALRQNVARFQASLLPVSLFRLLRAHGMPGYSLSPAGARKLIRLCLPLRPLDVQFPVVGPLTRNDGIDIAMSAALPRMQAFVGLPPLVASENRPETSTIQGKD